MSDSTAFCIGAKFRCGGTSSLGGATVGRRGSNVALNIPSSISWLRSRIPSCLSASSFSRFFRVHLDRVGKIHEVERQHFSVRQSHYRCAHGLRQCASIDEIRIGKMRVPVKVVVDRVIDPLLILAAISQVDRGDAEVIDERR